MTYAPPRKLRPTESKPGCPVSRAPKPTRQRALELLAGCGPEGCSEHVLKAHGFSVEQMVELVRDGLASATPQRTRAGREVVEVAMLRITDEGRKVLKAAKP
jgi:hypothetical protein